MKRLSLLTLIPAALAVTLAAPPATATEWLSGAEIKRLFTGKSLYFRFQPPGYNRTFVGRYEYLAGGKFRLTLGNRGPYHGRWWVDDTQLCREWTGTPQGKRRCNLVNSRGGNKVAFHKTTGEYVGDYELKP